MGIDEPRNVSKRYALYALVFNAAVLTSYIIFAGVSYESNDDYTLSVMISTAGYCNYSFINFFLCKFICMIQSVLHFANWFVLFQMLLSYIAFTAVTCIFLARNRYRITMALFFICITIFSFDHYSRIQFTKTSTLLITAGALLIIYAWMKSRGKALPYVFGTVLTVIGSMYRFQNILMIFGFAAVFILGFIITGIKRNMKTDVYRRKTRNILILSAIFLTIFAGSYAVNLLSYNMDHSTPGLQRYMTYDTARSAVSDYQMNYNECKETCRKCGISENSYNLMQWNWYYDYNGAASESNLIALGKSRTADHKNISPVSSTETFVAYVGKNIKGHSRTGMHIVILMAITVIGMLTFKKKWMFFPFFIGTFTILSYMYLLHIGRMPYRATYGIDLAAALFLIFSMNFAKARYNLKSGISKTFLTAAAVILVAVSLFINISAASSIKTQYGSVYYSDALLKYMQKNNDKVFVFDTRTSGSYAMHLSYYNEPLKKFPDSYNSNLLSFGGWGTLSPYNDQILSRFDIDNVFQDIINNKNVYVVDIYNKSDMEKYLNDYYGEKNRTIYYNYVDRISGMDIWRVCMR